MRKYIGYILLAVICLGLGLAASRLELSKESEPEIESSVLEFDFKDLATLTTQEYNFTNVGTFKTEDLTKWGVTIPFTGKSFILTYNGSVKAGLKDMSAISVDINDETQQVIINSPAVEVFDDTIIDTASVEVYDQKNGIFNPVTIEDFKDFVISEEDNAKQLAIDNGLLEKAQSNCENLLINYVKAIITNTDKKDYTITVNFQ